MIKNRTRKGLALAAAGSLALTGLAGVPAQATGLLVDGYVSMAPTTGTEYDVLTGNAKEFSLTATFSNAAEDTGEYLKFLVTNTNEDIVVVDSSSTQYSANAVIGADNVAFTNVGAVDRVSLNNITNNFKAGDAITVSGFEADEADAANADFTTANGVAVVETATSTTVTYLLGNLGTVGAFTTDSIIVVKLNTPAYTAATDSFVFNTKSDSNSTDKVLVLKTGNITTKRVATVTAWIDSNDNDTIQAGEYVSPTRTVTWNTAADVTVVTALTYPTAADASLAGTVTLTPNLNGNQLAADDITVGFTRPGSTATIYANATQASVSRAWSVTQSLGTGNWAGLSHIGQISKVTDNTGVTAGTMKVFTDGSYGVGDTVKVSGTTSQNNDVVGAATGLANSAAGAIVLADAAFDVAGKAEAAVDPETGFVQVVTRLLKDVSATVTAATYETEAVHGLNIGDIVTINALATANDGQFDITRAVIASIPSTTEFTVAGTFVAVSANTTDAGFLTIVSGIEAVPGTYSAKTKVATVARGNTSTNVSISNTSDDTTLATTATVDVQGVSNSDATVTSTYTTAFVRSTTTSVELVATVVDASDVAVTAGRSVKVSLETTEGNNTTNTGTFSVNGVAYTTAVYLTTNASGQVTFTVADNDGAAGTEVRVLVTPENLTGGKTADIELLWSAAVYSIFDMNDNASAASTGQNSISVNGSYAYALSVMDQWKNAPANGTHRVKYVTAGNNVATNYLTLVAGKADLSVTDNQIGAGSSISTTLSLDKLGTDGITWTQQDLLNDGDTNGGADTMVYTTSVLTQTDAVLLDSDGSTAYGAGTADLSNTATTTQLVPQDRRSANLVQPGYLTNVLVTGRVAHATTNVPRAGASVTISGPANILFSEGAVDGLGSLTFKTDSAGEFGVKLYSITVATNAVITVTSGGVSKTVKVSFTGQGASFGTSWTVTAPTSVLPGSTFQYKAKLTDKYGNGVTVAAPDIRVTYVGPGLIVGNLPTVTDANGELTFSVLMGSNDKGTATVTVSYDQGSDDDFTGTATGDLDIVTSNLITVGAVASSATKVNVGSFKGYVALYAKGYKGQKMTAIVAGKWIKVDSLASDFERVVRYTGAGYSITTKIYIDGVQIGDAFTTMTK